MKKNKINKNWKRKIKKRELKQKNKLKKKNCIKKGSKKFF